MPCHLDDSCGLLQPSRPVAGRLGTSECTKNKFSFASCAINRPMVVRVASVRVCVSIKAISSQCCHSFSRCLAPFPTTIPVYGERFRTVSL
jgi:hypothetical protein